MRLTKQTGHAIRILAALARAENQRLRIADIAETLDITKPNALKIVNMLMHVGLIATTRGRAGGIRLARPAEEIKIGDVVRLMEVTSIAVEGVEGQDIPTSGRDGRSLNEVLDDALSAFIGVLDQHSIADLVLPKPQRLQRKPQQKTKSAPLSVPRLPPRLDRGMERGWRGRRTIPGSRPRGSRS